MRASLSKDRDMARSILPSKNRRPARAAKARITRASRHRVRGRLQSVASRGDIDEWDERFDLREDTTIDVRMAVRHRRGGDKLNHFERWAVATTRDIRPDDRLSNLRARLPENLIGWHAMSHLERRPELNPALQTSYWRWNWEQRRRAQREAVLQERRQLEDAVRAFVERGGHKALNSAMKAVVQRADGTYDRPPHLLRDVRYVDAFVGGLYLPSRRDHTRSREFQAVQALVRSRR